MGTVKRDRQKAGRQARLAEAQAAAARRKRTRTGLLLVGLVGLLVIATLWMGGLGGDDEEPVESVAGDSSTSTTLADSGVEVTVPPAGAAIDGETPCPAADGSSVRTTSFAQPPPTCIDPALTYTATVTTTHGEFAFELDTAAAPVTANNFVVLARYHYYDGVAFHRIIPDFMIQTGDATGPTPGQGDPGYTIPDELPAVGGLEGYPPGAVAMANAGADSGGSQFFVMASTNTVPLDPNYAIFGRVVSGQDVVDAINLLGDAPSNGTPTAEVLIQTVTITEA